MARAFPALRHPPSAAPSPSCLPSLPSAILLSLSISLSRFSLFSPFLRSPSLLSARRLCFQPSSSLPASPPFNLKVSAFRAFQPLPLVTFRYAIPPRYCVAIVALLFHPRYPPPRNSSLRRISAISPLSSSSSSRLSPRSLSRGGGRKYRTCVSLPLGKLEMARALPRTYPVRINAKHAFLGEDRRLGERRAIEPPPRLPAFVSFFPRNVGHATRCGTDTFMRSNCAFSS